MKNVFCNIKIFIKNMKSHHISEYAAQCTYYTILSFIPFLILIITLLQYTGISKDAFVSIIQSAIPGIMSNATVDIVQEIYSKSVGTISISAIFVLFSARRGFYALAKGIQNIYETKKQYNYVFNQIKSLIITVLLVCLILLVLSFSVFGDSILEVIKINIEIPNFITKIIQASEIGIYFLVFSVLVLMYKFIPGKKLSLKKQIPGALIATLSWYVISFFLSIYIDTFKGFSIMYGSLTTIVLAMMWVYLGMYIILIGAEINNFKTIKEQDNDK